MVKRKNILDLLELKQTGRKITAVACYDYTTARLVGQADIDMILVGDSAAEALLGYDGYNGYDGHAYGSCPKGGS